MSPTRLARIFRVLRRQSDRRDRPGLPPPSRNPLRQPCRRCRTGGHRVHQDLLTQQSAGQDFKLPGVEALLRQNGLEDELTEAALTVMKRPV